MSILPTIQIDSREHAHAIRHIKDSFDRLGYKWFVSKMPCGDYQSLDNARLCIDRKQSLLELHTNVCQQHERFRNELIRANDLGIKLIFLVEHSYHFTTLSDVRHWNNPRLRVSPYALDGMALYQRLQSIEVKYNTVFHFCTKGQTGARIIQLLQKN